MADFFTKYISSKGIEKYANAMKKSDIYWYRMRRSSGDHCGSKQLHASIAANSSDYSTILPENYAQNSTAAWPVQENSTG